MRGDDFTRDRMFDLTGLFDGDHFIRTSFGNAGSAGAVHTGKEGGQTVVILLAVFLKRMMMTAGTADSQS